MRFAEKLASSIHEALICVLSMSFHASTNKAGPHISLSCLPVCNVLGVMTFQTEEEWTQLLMLISHHLLPPVSFSYPLGGQGDIKGAADCILKPKGSHLGWTVADISPTLGFKSQQRPSGHDTQLFYRALKQHSPAGIIKERILFFQWLLLEHIMKSFVRGFKRCL